MFQSKDGVVSLPVPVDGKTVWLTQSQMAQLFGEDKTVVARHIRNAISEGEIDPKVVCAKFAHTTRHGALPGRSQTHEVTLYNLDVVISVGYRVHSLRGVEFRRWATSVLRRYLVDGYAVNAARLKQLGRIVDVMKRASGQLDAKQVLDVVSTYSAALDLLDAYDHQTVGKPEASARSIVLSYDECRR